MLPDPELSVKEKLGLAGPSLPLDRFYDERFRRLQKLRHDIHASIPASTAEIMPEKLSCSSTTRGFCFNFEKTIEARPRSRLRARLRRAEEIASVSAEEKP